jgi:hypothetical protein
MEAFNQLSYSLATDPGLFAGLSEGVTVCESKQGFGPSNDIDAFTAGFYQTLELLLLFRCQCT